MKRNPKKRVSVIFRQETFATIQRLANNLSISEFCERATVMVAQHMIDKRLTEQPKEINDEKETDPQASQSDGGNRTPGASL